MGIDMKKLAAVLLLISLVIPSFAHADSWHRDQHWRGDIRHFNRRDIDYWHTGHWYHGRHGGRLGWYWVLGPNFYAYGAPVYPYPDPFQPPMVASAPYVVTPPPVVAVPPPAIMAPSPAVRYWYYCNKPHGYYPYVPACYGRWHAVPGY
jgi:hypothetical protein